MVIKSNSNILITGAGQGIGRGLARHFLEKGHSVYLIDINKEGLEHTAKVHLEKHKEKLDYSVCNLGSVDEIRSTVDKAAKFFGGRIDHLINNAGISAPYWSDDKTMEDKSVLKEWQSYLDINMTGPFAMSQACIPYMKLKNPKEQDERVGSPCIIHVSSFRAIVSDPNQEGYASSKAGLIGLAHSMAMSMKVFGIRVNMVAPGRVKVPHESKQGDEEGKKWKAEDDDIEKHATNRAGTPEDIAEAIEYMLGAGFVTGQELFVDGGVSKMKGGA